MTWVLPGPGARDDEQRPLPVGHRAKLVRIEPAEQPVHALRDRGPSTSAGSITGTRSRQAGICSSGIGPRRRARTRRPCHGGWVRRGVGSTMGAMCGPSPTAVTPRLSGRRLLDRRRLLLRQRGRPIGRPDRPSRRRRVPVRAWRLDSTQPLPSASSSASAKLWLPPVSSNGLNRTRPTRWNARGAAVSSRPVRVPNRSTSRPSSWTRSRWAPSTSPRSPSSPRVSPRTRPIQGARLGERARRRR